ncbi:MAG: DUF2306 domain-containing protein [Myxococcales bacterium]|nr:DUF2306 domain-containing protein [Myxococcales bacterium]
MSLLSRGLWGLVAVGGLLWVAYIAVFYGGRALLGDWWAWNAILRNLHREGEVAANLGIGVHLAAGALITLIGPLQLLPSIRAAAPAIHRALGRIYVFAALAAGIGGSLFILLRGTLGGAPMSLGFGLYGALVTGAAILTLRYARRRDLQRHRRWAIRLFALGVGSLLYRVEYSLWALFTGMAGHDDETWRGGIDLVMDFFFYVPTLAVAELYLRLPPTDARPPWLRGGLVVALALGGLLGAVGLALATIAWWWPPVEAVLFAPS